MLNLAKGVLSTGSHTELPSPFSNGNVYQSYMYTYKCYFINPLSIFNISLTFNNKIYKVIYSDILNIVLLNKHKTIQ